MPTGIYNRKNNKVKRICENCGKEIMIFPYLIKKSGNKFCSRKCKGKWMSKNLKKNNHSSWRGGKIKRKCEICGKSLFRNKAKIKNGEGKFCSLKCRDISHSKNYRGEKCNFWKGGITPIVKMIRENIKYKQWRQDIFMRDNFTCQNKKCNLKGGNLEAHHKKPFHILVEEVKKYLPLLNLYDGAMIYTPLWDLDNGVTLCEKCHYKTNKGRPKK